MDKTQYAVPSQMPTSAEVINSDYDPQTDPYTGMPAKPFKKGGIATLRYNGAEDGSDVQAWDPASGQVTLQKYNTQDPSAEPTQVAYKIPKDSIKTFVANTNDSGQEDPSMGGKYILNDGSTMIVGGDGTVQAATPARNEYTLNQDKYYQPTGENLNWNGATSSLTKNIGGVDVQVPGMYTKGGYQDQQGNLRTDQYGVPVPLAPNYLDSGAGKSGLSDAAPLMAIAAMAAMTGGAAAPEALSSMDAYMASAGLDAGTYGSEFLSPEFASVETPMEGSGLPPTESNPYTPEQMQSQYEAQDMMEQARNVNAPPGSPEAWNTATAAKGLTAAKAAKALAGLNMLTSGMKSTGTQPGGIAGGTPVAAAPTISPSVNQFGVTGYSGDAPIGSGYVGYTPTLSKIRGATGEMAFAAGGPTGGIATLGAYSDGGQLLKGPGDGMSDNIPAKIGDHQPARLADGEFVIPADVVSHLGNGSTDAGAKQLYAMMDRIRKARTGNKKQGKQINPSKFLP
jgi:hypothetical protein